MLPWPAISRNFSVSEPSNKIMATDNETTGNNKLPNNASASSTPQTGPTRIPTISRGKIAGSRTLYAKYWHPIESKPTATNDINGSDKVHSLCVIVVFFVPYFLVFTLRVSWKRHGICCA